MAIWKAHYQTSYNNHYHNNYFRTDHESYAVQCKTYTRRRMKGAQPDLTSCHCYVLQLPALSTLFFRLTVLEVWVYVRPKLLALNSHGEMMNSFT